MALSLSVVENKPFAVFTNFLAKNLLLSGPSERCCLLVCLLVGRSWVLQSQYLKQDLKQWHSEKDQWRVRGRGPGNPAPPPSLFLDQSEAWRAGKKKLDPPPPPPPLIWSSGSVTEDEMASLVSLPSVWQGKFHVLSPPSFPLSFVADHSWTVVEMEIIDKLLLLWTQNIWQTIAINFLFVHD